jgi:hypothetical protein
VIAETDKRMNLADLIQLVKYNDKEGLTYRESLAKALAGKIEIFYVFDGMMLVIYDPIDDSHNGKGTENNMFGGPESIEIEYSPCDFIHLTPKVLRDLWGYVSYEDFEVRLGDLVYEHVPEGFKLATMLDGYARAITIDNLYIKPGLPQETKVSGDNENKQSNNALKVIGLLMRHLAKTPKYASGDSPNKSQIKELLLDLAEELKVNSYGLSKVDERLLSDAMTYLEEQKK